MAHRTYQTHLDNTSEYGVVEEIRYPLVLARGLPGVSLSETVVFENGQMGYVTGLTPELVEIALLSRDAVALQSKVTRTGEHLGLRLSDSLRGQVVGPLGDVVLSADRQPAGKAPGTGRPSAPETRHLEVEPPTIADRAKIDEQLITGISIVDVLLPLSYGQRSVVLGDQKTGKTSFMLSLLKSQADAGTLVVYAAIGKRWRDMQQAVHFLHQQTKPENVVMVAADPHDAPGMIYLTPFTAMTVAEYFRDQGQHVVVVLDDLSTHANFYREMSLLGKRFPGRESYPGDMFYVHARLLERAGSFKHFSITCLAVAQTVNNAMTGSIVSNLISMTDGHLLFDTGIFNEGRHPAIDYSLSVTRVGQKVQSPIGRELHQRITALLARYSSTKRFTHFGAELGEDAQTLLDTGAVYLEFFSQPPDLRVPEAVQYVMAAMIGLHWFRGLPIEKMTEWRRCLVDSYEKDQSVRAMIDRLAKSKDLASMLAELPHHKQQLMALCRVTEDETVQQKTHVQPVVSPGGRGE